MENIRDAIQLHIEALLDHRQPVPPERFEALLIAV